MKIPLVVQKFYYGVTGGDVAALLILLGVLTGILVLITVIVNVRAEQRNRRMPPPDWGSKSTRFKE